MTSMQTSPGQGGQPPNRAQIQDLIGSMRVTQLIYVAASLGIADQLKDGPKSIAELASTAAVDPDALYRVLRALASHGIFAETGDCHFALTPQAELLREDVPGSLRAWAMMLGGASCWKPWGELLECVKTGETAFNRVFGMGRWEDLAAHPDAAATFNRMSASNTEGRATPIVEVYDFAAARTVIDLGGGRGGLLAAILTRHPDVTGVLADLPAVVDEAKAFLATQGLGDRCAVVACDLLASVPQGGDIYVMKSVLHGLHDEHVVAVLQHCRAAMTASATLLVIEAVLPPHGSPSSLINMLDVHRMVINGSRERSQDELRAFLETAGFSLHRVIQTGTQDNIFEALPVEPRGWVCADAPRFVRRSTAVGSRHSRRNQRRSPRQGSVSAVGKCHHPSLSSAAEVRACTARQAGPRDGRERLYKPESRSAQRPGSPIAAVSAVRDSVGRNISARAAV